MARPGPKQDAGNSDDALKYLHLWQIQAVRDVLLVASVAGLVWLGYALRAVTVPLLVALLLAYLFEPLVARLSRHPKLTRPMVVAGLLMTVGALAIGVVAVFVPVAVAQTAGLVRDYQDGRFRETAVKLSQSLPETWREQADGLIEFLPEREQDTDEEPQVVEDTPSQPTRRGGFVSAGRPAEVDEQRMREIVREELEQAGVGTESNTGSMHWLGVARGGARAAAILIGGIVQIGFLAFLIPFYFFFFSVWFPAVVRFGRSLIPIANRQRTLELIDKMDAVVAGFVRGRIVVSMIMGLMLAVGWKIAGVPYSIVLGLVVGLFCAVPYLGAIGVPVAVGLLAFRELSLADGGMQWYWILLWPTLVYGVVQTIEGYLLTPMIAGKATNLDPVTILVVVLAGGSIMGIYGMLLAIPVAACVKILCTDLLLPKIRA
ncbi:MAG: AI-2E family transporter, partial [Phycisphaerales bacterium]